MLLAVVCLDMLQEAQWAESAEIDRYRMDLCLFHTKHPKITATAPTITATAPTVPVTATTSTAPDATEGIEGDWDNIQVFERWKHDEFKEG